MVIGLEIHVQLATRTKLFCADVAESGGAPNTRVCPVCLGLPGALPVLNRAAVRLAVRAATALSCAVQATSVFVRKSYFYPDLPKGYQITQMSSPLAIGGWLDVETGGSGGGSGADGAGRVRLRRVHLEEDAGRSLHDRVPGRTGVDLNRAGVPLIEIVTEPDLAGPAEARAFLGRLKQLLEYLEVSDCDMEKGSLRVDANLSLRRPGGRPGTPTEVKNMNSFGNVERALTFEAERQRAVVAGGGAVSRETLLWDADAGEARPMRARGADRDYRYFADPDLAPLVIGAALLDEEAAALPELPAERMARLRDELGLRPYDARVLTATRALADYFEAVAAEAGDARAASGWVMTEVLGWLNERGVEIRRFPIPAGRLGELIRLTAEGVVSRTAARHVMGTMAETGRTAREIVDAEGLTQVSDRAALARWVEEVVADHPDEAARVRAGEEAVLGFLMGQLMKRSDGKADPVKASALLRARLV